MARPLPLAALKGCAASRSTTSINQPPPSPSNGPIGERSAWTHCFRTSASGGASCGARPGSPIAAVLALALGHRGDDGDFQRARSRRAAPAAVSRSRSADDGVGSERRQRAVARADLAGQLRRLSRPLAGVRGRRGVVVSAAHADRNRARAAARSTRSRRPRNFFSRARRSAGPRRRASRASPFYSRETIAVISHRLWRERFGADPCDRRQDDRAERAAVHRSSA